MALHLEDRHEPFADVDDAGVLARALHDDLAGRRQRAQPLLRALVGAVLVPHRREDAELGQRRLAPDEIEDALIFVGLQAVVGDELRRDRSIMREHPLSSLWRRRSSAARPPGSSAPARSAISGPNRRTSAPRFAFSTSMTSCGKPSGSALSTMSTRGRVEELQLRRVGIFRKGGLALAEPARADVVGDTVRRGSAGPGWRGTGCSFPQSSDTLQRPVRRAEGCAPRLTPPSPQMRRPSSRTAASRRARLARGRSDPPDAASCRARFPLRSGCRRYRAASRSDCVPSA